MATQMKCVICDTSLVEAVLGPCGCQYCGICIYYCLDNNSKTSSGGNNIVEDINNNEPNDSTNKLLSYIRSHLSKCKTEPILFSTNDIESVPIKRKSKIMLEKLLLEVSEHSKLLVEWVSDMRQILEIEDLSSDRLIFPKLELTPLITSIEESMEEKMLLENLKNKIHFLNIKNKEFVSIAHNIDNIEAISLDEIDNNFQGEFTQVKKESQIEIKNMNSQLDKINKINYELIEKKEKKIDKLKQDKAKLIKQMSELHLAIERSNQKMKSMSKSGTRTPPTKRRMKTLEQKLFENSNNNTSLCNISTDFCTPKIASHVWHISDVSRKRHHSTNLASEYFHCNHQEHEIRLWFWPGGCLHVRGTHMSIGCLIGGAQLLDCQLPYMFQGLVTMTVKNKSKSKFCQSISRHFKLDKKNNIEIFHFSNTDLLRARVLRHNYISIECVVVFQ